MIISELKKIWRSRLLWVFLGVLAALNFCQINAMSRREKGDSASFSAARAQIYAQIRGAWEYENIQFVVDTYEAAEQIVASGSFSTEPDQEGTYTGYIFGDFSLFGEFYDEMNYMYNYAETMNATIEKAKQNIAFFEAKHNPYAVRQNQQILTLYQGRHVDAYYKTQGVFRLISYDFSSAFVLLLCILCISPVFTREHETQMFALLKVTKNGGTRLGLSKILAALISAAGIALLFYLIDFFGFVFLFDIDCLSNPIYSISDYQNTPFSCSIGAYLLIVLLYRLIGVAVMALIYLLCSLLMPDEILSFCMSIAVTVLLLFCGGSLNPMMMLTVRDLHRDYQVYDLFGFPVLQHIVLLAAMILLSAALVVIIAALSKKQGAKHRVLHIRRAKGKE